MAQQQLDATYVGARLQQMGGKGMPQRVRRDGLVDAGGAVRLLAGLLNRFLGDVMALDSPGNSHGLGRSMRQ
jgi:hypothetical protein